MRYLSLAEAVQIAEAVTRIDVNTLAKVSRLELLDSALHAPQAGFGDEEFYPDLIDKAAVLAVHIARNHPVCNQRVLPSVILSGGETRNKSDPHVDIPH